MPDRLGGYVRMETISLDLRKAIDHQFQAHWYRHVAPMTAGMSVLDVGAGTGYGLPILRAAGASSVVGFDPLPAGDGVIPGVLDDYANKSYDWVLLVDVIEHVDADVALYERACGVARKHVFITTPNWLVSHAANEYHVREYTPAELRKMLADRRFDLWMSDNSCNVIARDHLDDAEPLSNFGVLVHV